MVEAVPEPSNTLKAWRTLLLFELGFTFAIAPGVPLSEIVNTAAGLLTEPLAVMLAVAPPPLMLIVSAL